MSGIFSKYPRERVERPDIYLLNANGQLPPIVVLFFPAGVQFTKVLPSFQPTIGSTTPFHNFQLSPRNFVGGSRVEKRRC